MDEMNEVFESVARYFSILAEPARLRILHSICQQERSVGQIVEETGMTQTNVSRRFFLRMDNLGKHQIDGNVFIGHGARFPAVVGSNPVQFSYYEDAPDGTIRQWDAVSGTVIFDAIDTTLLVNNPLVGETYQTTGKVSFHTENVRMEPSNSTSDPRFVGAKGSFILNYAGTATVGYKRYSRDW